MRSGHHQLFPECMSAFGVCARRASWAFVAFGRARRTATGAQDAANIKPQTIIGADVCWPTYMIDVRSHARLAYLNDSWRSDSFLNRVTGSELGGGQTRSVLEGCTVHMGPGQRFKPHGLISMSNDASDTLTSRAAVTGRSLLPNITSCDRIQGQYEALPWRHHHRCQSADIHQPLLIYLARPQMSPRLSQPAGTASARCQMSE
jgi:hypothetical protein